MKFDQLQYFVETARRQHIGQAAKFLNISPGAISHSISALEEELGHSLFEKQGRQIKLTHHGKLLLDRAEFLLAEAARIREDLTSSDQELRGHYRIAATHLMCSEIVTPAWMDLQAQNPKLTSTIHSLRSGEVLARVNSGEVDLGVCFSPHSGPNHDQQVLHHGRLVLAFGKKHPFLKERNMDSLKKYPSIAALASHGIENCEQHPAFQKYLVEPRIVMLFDSYDVAVHALKNKDVWTLLPDFIAYSHRQEIETYIPRGWDADYKISAIWPKFRVRTQALDLLIEEVAQKIKKLAQREAT